MKTITTSVLADILIQTTGAKPVTLVAFTDTRARKTNNPYGRIWKRSKVNGMVGFHYDPGVIRRLLKEGKDPEAFKRGESWHEPVMLGDHLTPLCRHKSDPSRLYLRFMYLATIGEPDFFSDNGTKLDYADVAQFLPASSEYKNQGLDNPLRFLVYSLESLESLTMCGEEYVVESELAKAA